MITLLPTSKQEIKDLITKAFEGDRDLLENFHVSPGDLDHCVTHTYAFIEGNKDFFESDMELYRVQSEEEDIGFTVVIKHADMPNELYSFGIAKQYRKKEILLSWLIEVESLLGLPYFLVLWNVNTRAIQFFQRNGFIVEQRNELTKLIIKDGVAAVNANI